MTKFTSVDLLKMLACARREAKMRAAVYPRRVKNRMMSQGEANSEIALMERICELLQEQLDGKPGSQASLFAPEKQDATE